MGLFLDFQFPMVKSALLINVLNYTVVSYHPQWQECLKFPNQFYLYSSSGCQDHEFLYVGPNNLSFHNFCRTYYSQMAYNLYVTHLHAAWDCPILKRLFHILFHHCSPNGRFWNPMVCGLGARDWSSLKMEWKADDVRYHHCKKIYHISFYS